MYSNRFLHSLPIKLRYAALTVADIIYSIRAAVASEWFSHSFSRRLRKNLSTSDPELTIDFDLSNAYGGLGDFLIELCVARVIQEVDPRILATRIYGWPFQFENIELSGFSTENRLKEFESLLNLNPTEIEFTADLKLLNRGPGHDVLTILKWSQGKRFHHGSGNLRLIDRLHKDFGVQPTELFNWCPQGRYVGLHVRGTPPHEGRNPSRAQVMNDVLEIARCFPQLEVRIFSKPSPPFLRELLDELASAGVRVQMQQAVDFHASINEIMGSDFWFQRKGGGAAVPVIFSGMPYLILSSDIGGRVVYGSTRDKFASWSLPTQTYITSYWTAEEASVLSAKPELLP